jgi:hypothetical protein
MAKVSEPTDNIRRPIARGSIQLIAPLQQNTKSKHNAPTNSKRPTAPRNQ